MLELGQIRYLGTQGVWPKMFKINIYIPSLSDDESGYIIDAVPWQGTYAHDHTRVHRIWSGSLKAFKNSVAPNIRDKVLDFTQTLLNTGRLKMPEVDQTSYTFFEGKTA